MPVGKQVPDAERRSAGPGGSERGEQHDLRVRDFERRVGAEIAAGHGIGFGQGAGPEQGVSKSGDRGIVRT